MSEDKVEMQKKKTGYEWIKSDKTGVSYLCPTGSIKDKKTATDEDLKEVCIDESLNPHNE